MAVALHVFRKLRNEFAHDANAPRFADVNMTARVKALLKMNPIALRFATGTKDGDPFAKMDVRSAFDFYYALVATELADVVSKVERLEGA